VNILLSWLRDYIDIQVPPEKIADALLMAGIEVESIQEPGKHLKNVVVGQVLSKVPHPNADKLSLCSVEIGKGTPLQIVCGAPNHKVGDKIPVALIGAVLPMGFEIRVAKIRGIESFGMLCSKKELGLSEDHSGLLILPSDTLVGTDIVKVLGLDDVVFEISVTPNRGDALSHLGIARELSAIFNLPLNRNPLDGTDGESAIDGLTSVTINEPELCPRYGARLVQDVSVGESPKWLKERLEKIGIRSINNVVDITNYVMLDIGHPMHAFDLDRLDERRICVRRATQGEVIESLDEVKRTLDPSMLVIADAKKPVAIAGVMGGQETKVTQKTRNVLLEAAYFNPISIRKTAKTLGMMSDSSYRFERGTNIDNIPIALNLAARLIKDVAGGKPVEGIIDAFPAPPPLKRVMLRARRVARVLGIELKPQQIETLLLRLKFEVSREGETLWIGVPPFRHDIEQEVDLIEEVARLFGYENIPHTLPMVFSEPVLPTPIQKLGKRVREYLVDQGFHETIAYSFIPTRIPDTLKEGPPLVIRNPLSEDQGHLRTSLLWGMIDAVKRNIFCDEFALRFFEVGRAYHKEPSGFAGESDRLCIGCCGPFNPADWNNSGNRFDLFRLKGMLASIGRLVRQDFEFARGTHFALHPTRQFELRLQGKHIGYLGQINPSFRDNKKIPEEIFLAEIDLGALANANPVKTLMKPIPEFPAIRRDIAVVLPKTAQFSQIRHIIVEEGGDILENCTLFDIYEGKGIESGKRSVALSITFRAKDRTLKDEDVQPHVDAALRKLGEKLQGKLRA